MDARPPATIAAHSADLPDPRIDRARRHDLPDIVTIAVCAVIGGADAWADVECVGRAKQGWFETSLALPNGIPSHDTFGRVFGALDPAAFETAFLGWVRALITAPACIAGQLVDRVADDVLALTANQPNLHELVLHRHAPDATHRTVDKDHGRLDARTCRATGDPAVIAWLDPAGAWPRPRSIAAVKGERRIGATVTTKTRYYLSSLPADAVREKWGIENGLHWVLDVAFRADERRVRCGHAAQNLAVLRVLALTLLRRETTKVDITAKRLMCGWDATYLLKVLAG